MRSRYDEYMRDGMSENEAIKKVNDDRNTKS
jgi:uncharacterized protein YoaH (UPF0181 family)